MQLPFRAAYIAFDPHPSYKGASTHIGHFAAALANAHGPLLLLTLKGDQEAIRTEQIHQECFVSSSLNLLDRAMEFTKWVKNMLAQHHSILIVHFRDVWGGMASLHFPHLRSVFEVNGVPSIELPYRYPMLSPDTLIKLAALEDYCLGQAHAVITPSHTTAKYLMGRGVPSHKLTVIPNGAELPAQCKQPTDLPSQYFAYIGAVQPWQGIADLLRALRYLEDTQLPLVICCSHQEHLAKSYREFAEQAGVAHRVIWRYQYSRAEVNRVLQHAQFSVAPLTECSRNIEQGCSPLKVIESMANGTAVIASGVPPVQEIIEHRVDGILCRPSRPTDLARNIRLAIENPVYVKTLGATARQKVSRHFTWEKSGATLQATYNTLFTLA